MSPVLHVEDDQHAWKHQQLTAIPPAACIHQSCTDGPAFTNVSKHGSATPHIPGRCLSAAFPSEQAGQLSFDWLARQKIPVMQTCIMQTAVTRHQQAVPEGRHTQGMQQSLTWSVQQPPVSDLRSEPAPLPDVPSEMPAVLQLGLLPAWQHAAPLPAG